MPKRSNDMQKFVHRIYEHLKPTGASITESKMIYDKDAEIDREVDVCIEVELAGEKITFIVECRDHKRDKQGVEWIEQIIAKAKALKANKIIAVSSSGFSKPGLKKAEAYGIETYSLIEACDENWNRLAFKPGISLVGHEQYQLLKYAIYLDEDGSILPEIDHEDGVYWDGKLIGTFKDFLTDYFSQLLVPEMDKYVSAELKKSKSKSDFLKTGIIESTRHFHNLEIEHSERIRIPKIIFVFKSTRKVWDFEFTHKVFKEKLFSHPELCIGETRNDVFIQSNEDTFEQGKIKISKKK
mgnify:CR=1 FL=1